MLTWLAIVSEGLWDICYVLMVLHIKRLWGDKRLSVFFFPPLLFIKTNKKPFSKAIIYFLTYLYLHILFSNSQLFIFDRSPRSATIFEGLISVVVIAMFVSLLSQLVANRKPLYFLSGFSLLVLLSGVVLSFHLQSSIPIDTVTSLLSIIFIFMAIYSITLLLTKEEIINIEVIVFIFALAIFQLITLFQGTSLARYLPYSIGLYLNLKFIITSIILLGSLIWIPKLKSKYTILLSQS